MYKDKSPASHLCMCVARAARGLMPPWGKDAMAHGTGGGTLTGLRVSVAACAAGAATGTGVSGWSQGTAVHFVFGDARPVARNRSRAGVEARHSDRAGLKS